MSGKLLTYNSLTSVSNMSKGFKPGDLVVITGAVNDTQNVGKVAELIELLPPKTSSRFIMPNGNAATHEYPEPCWFLSGDNLTQDDPECNGFALRHPKFLMPLHGDENPDATLATERPTELVSA